MTTDMPTQNDQPTAEPGGWRNWSTRTKALVIGAVIVLVIIVLGALGRPSSPPVATLIPAQATALTTTAPASSRCQAAPTPLVDAISTGLDSGLSLRNAQLVKSNDFQQAYFVSADLQGPGLDGADDLATWVTNSTTAGEGLIYSVNAVAEEFSDWGPGGQTDAQFSMSDDGATESQDCVLQQ